jgi:hypothetical protein
VLTYATLVVAFPVFLQGSRSIVAVNSATFIERIAPPF